MGYDLQRTETVFANPDQHDWLGSAHGTDSASSITLDTADLLSAYDDGQVPAGVEVSRNTTSGRYELGASGVGTTHDRAGFLLHSVTARSSAPTVIGALLWHGRVLVDRVPVPDGGSAPSAINHPLIQLV